MRVALVNPLWSFENSIYFGCREPHLPLELGCCKTLLERAGHEVLLLDGALMGEDHRSLASRIAAFAPGMTIVTTAPTYLFWRCAQPELRVPRDFLVALQDYFPPPLEGGAGGGVATRMGFDDREGLACCHPSPDPSLKGRGEGKNGGITVAVGPHGSSTPVAALKKLGCDIVVRGECEEAVLALAEAEGRPEGISGLCYRHDGEIVTSGPPAATRFTDLPALHWPSEWVARHSHHHHRYGSEPRGFGAEVEASRGCPYTCSFCAKLDFRDGYRKRDLAPLLTEIDALIAQGARYLYFIDEIFLPNRPLLEALRNRKVEFGIQTRIDLWKPDMLDLLGAAGCVSIEAGVESLTVEGRAALDKKCRMTTDELADRLIHARRSVPFVQANLLQVARDDADLVTAWREKLFSANVWANDPVPLYPYPSSPDYRKLFGAPDEAAWERAHGHYLEQFTQFSDIQDETPLPLRILEAACPTP